MFFMWLRKIPDQSINRIKKNKIRLALNQNYFQKLKRITSFKFDFLRITVFSFNFNFLILGNFDLN